MKSIISSQALSLMRPYKPILIGSAAYGNVHANDIDMLICVDVEKLGEVEGQLTALGFVQQVPDPETLDPRVRSAWKLDKLDIQIATPGNYENKVACAPRGVAQAALQGSDEGGALRSTVQSVC